MCINITNYIIDNIYFAQYTLVKLQIKRELLKSIYYCYFLKIYFSHDTLDKIPNYCIENYKLLYYKVEILVV